MSSVGYSVKTKYFTFNIQSGRRFKILPLVFDFGNIDHSFQWQWLFWRGYYFRCGNKTLLKLRRL